MISAFSSRISVVLAIVAGTLVIGAGSAAASSRLPYVDPNAVGSIGLCDQAGNSLTHGSIDDKPFIWKAVDETAATTPYNEAGASATLYAYQPRQGVDPREWGGAQISGASKFTDPTHPTAAMTGLDGSLALFMTQYRPEWQGLIQLRIYLGAPNEPIYNSTYDSTAIQVTGQKWNVVDPSSVACSSGSAVSIEQDLATSSAVAASLTARSTESAGSLLVTTSASQRSKSSNGTKPVVSPQGPGSGETSFPSSASSGGISAVSSAAADPPAHGKTSIFDFALWALIVIAVGGAGFAAVQWRRSRG